MKQFRSVFIVMLMLVGMLLLTGCDKINFSTFDASKEESNTEISPTDQVSKGSEKDNTKVSDKKENTKDSNKDSTNNSSKKNTKDASGKDASGEEDTTKTTVETSGSVNSQTPTPTPSLIQPTENIDLSVYTVNANSGEVEPVTAAIPKISKLSPELIVDTVVESLADQSIIIGIKNVTTKGDIVIVNFTKENTPFKNLGSGYEGAILDAFAQSLLENLDKYNKIIFRIDDKAYAGGAYEYGIDEVYLEQ